jgi:hypothetical protein
MQTPQRVFSNNVGAVGDARFIFEGLDAAKAILTTANNFVDPEKTLRYLPLRFYLYLVYAGVFLYRARCTGVISGDEDFAMRAMINETVSRLQRSSPDPGSPGTGTVTGTANEIQHPGSRYGQLLKLLWAKIPRKDKPASTHTKVFRHPGTNTANSNIPHESSSTFPNQIIMQSPATDIGSSSTTSPPTHTGAGPEPMGDFGWTDLSAIGDFAINGAAPAGPGASSVEDAAFWNGFLPLDMGWRGSVADLGLGWDGGGGGGGLGGEEMRMGF